MNAISVPGVVMALALPLAAWAQSGLPTGANVVAGSATIASTANSMTVTTASHRTIINYNGFGVGAGNSVRFDQPSSSSATLNRVIGTEGSAILGSVSSNGQIFLVNPNGIFVGPGGSFSGSSVYLSTGNISNADFLGGNIRFDPPPAESVIRFAGTIDATDTVRIHSGILDLSGTPNIHGGTIIYSDTGNILTPSAPITDLSISPTPSIQPSVGTLSMNGSVSGVNIGLAAGTPGVPSPPPTVPGGSATIATGSAGLTVQSSNGAIIDWSMFSIGAGQATHFAQPGSNIPMLNGSATGGSIGMAGGVPTVPSPPTPVAGGSIAIATGFVGLTAQTNKDFVIAGSKSNISAGPVTQVAQPGSNMPMLPRVRDTVQIFGTLSSTAGIGLASPGGMVLGTGGTAPVSAIKSGMSAVALPAPPPSAVPAPPPLPAARPFAASVPRGASGLVDGTVTVRLSLVDGAPIALR